MVCYAHKWFIWDEDWWILDDELCILEEEWSILPLHEPSLFPLHV